MIEINKKVISWLLVILWAGLIFFMSSMNTNESNTKSMKTIDKAIESTLEVTNKTGITNKHPSENKMQRVIKELNQPLRKVAHASEYLILTILLIVALSNSGISGKKLFAIAILLCFIYACTDEYHQTFVEGRTGQFTDILIDIIGAITGLICIYIIIKIVKQIKVENKSQN